MFHIKSFQNISTLYILKNKAKSFNDSRNSVYMTIYYRYVTVLMSNIHNRKKNIYKSFYIKSTQSVYD